MVNRRIPQPSPGTPDAYLAAYAADQGIDLEEAGLWISAMTQVIDTIVRAASLDDPSSYGRFEPFGVGVVDTGGDPVRVMAELADIATTTVGLLTRPPYPSFDTKGYATRVAATFGQPDGRAGDLDMTKVPVAWWQTPLGRLAGRAIRG